MGSQIPDMTISASALFSLVRGFSASRPNPDDSDPVGPWGPVMREALRDMQFESVSRFGPHPDPWRETFDSSWRVALASFLRLHPEAWDAVIPQYREALGDLVALNPQPLPPRALFMRSLVRQVIMRADNIGEMAVLLHDDGGERGIIFVGGYVQRFVDEWCGTVRPKWPFPWPRPHWLEEPLAGPDLLVAASEFAIAADIGADVSRQAFADASGKFAEVGLDAMR